MSITTRFRFIGNLRWKCWIRKGSQWKKARYEIISRKLRKTKTVSRKLTKYYMNYLI